MNKYLTGNKEHLEPKRMSNLKQKNRRENVLIVDDDPANMELLAHFLKKQGYNVQCAISGKEALAQVQSSPPDLILLDIIMPEMDGFEVCQHLKDNEKTNAIPVIFISALDEVLDKVKAFSFGGVDYITKPFEYEEVRARVENHLTIYNLRKELEKQNIHLAMEINARVAAEEELRNLNAELEQRVKERTLLLGAERERSEKLLLNILPQPIAERLKLSQEQISEDFKDVTVLFADIVNFTEISTHFTSNEMVNLLNRIFTSFDRLAEKYKLEKIKTIGDAYLVVGGLPGKMDEHTKAIAEMALDMQDAIDQLSKKLNSKIQIRIGINTGPVTAGVIGEKKFIYDLWGDTVNTASRMESCALPGDIQMTKDTYRRIKNSYEIEERGFINVKGKGKMEAYILKGRLINETV